MGKPSPVSRRVKERAAGYARPSRASAASGVRPGLAGSLVDVRAGPGSNGGGRDRVGSVLPLLDGVQRRLSLGSARQPRSTRSDAAPVQPAARDLGIRAGDLGVRDRHDSSLRDRARAGRWRRSGTRASPPTRSSPALASLLLPGWGQLLAGHRRRAVLFLGGLWILGAAWLLVTPSGMRVLSRVGLMLPAAMCATVGDRL